MKWLRRRNLPRPVRDLTRVRCQPGDTLIVRYVDGLLEPHQIELLGVYFEPQGVTVLALPVSDLDAVQMSVVGPVA